MSKIDNTGTPITQNSQRRGEDSKVYIPGWPMTLCFEPLTAAVRRLLAEGEKWGVERIAKEKNKTKDWGAVKKKRKARSMRVCARVCAVKRDKRGYRH